MKIDEEEKAETLRTLFDMAVSQLVDYSSLRIPSGTRVAAVPLIASAAGAAAQAEYFTEQLTLSVSRAEAFRMVERQDLQKILEELELGLSGLVDDAAAAKVGELAGAEMLITGRLFSSAERYDVFLKLLRVETGEVLSVTKARVARELGL